MTANRYLDGPITPRGEAFIDSVITDTPRNKQIDCGYGSLRWVNVLNDGIESISEGAVLGRLVPAMGSRCSSVVRAFAHGAVGRRIDPSWGGPIDLFLVPATRLV